MKQPERNNRIAIGLLIALAIAPNLGFLIANITEGVRTGRGTGFGDTVIVEDYRHFFDRVSAPTLVTPRTDNPADSRD